MRELPAIDLAVSGANEKRGFFNGPLDFFTARNAPEALHSTRYSELSSKQRYNALPGQPIATGE
jgi:hypothetical protein